MDKLAILVIVSLVFGFVISEDVFEWHYRPIIERTRARLPAWYCTYLCADGRCEDYARSSIISRLCLDEDRRPEETASGWGRWGAWSRCSRSCGGLRFRRRRCDGDRRTCIGRSVDVARCNQRTCNRERSRIVVPRTRVRIGGTGVRVAPRGKIGPTGGAISRVTAVASSGGGKPNVKRCSKVARAINGVASASCNVVVSSG